MALYKYVYYYYYYYDSGKPTALALRAARDRPSIQAMTVATQIQSLPLIYRLYMPWYFIFPPHLTSALHYMGKQKARAELS